MRILPLALPLLLAACATAPAPAPVQTPPPPPPPGMERVLGQPAETAVSLLGQPRLDKAEGDARLLQFAGTCILDLWYYPRPAPPAVATHAESRLPDGRPFAAGQCFQMLMANRAAAQPQPAAAPAPPRAAPRRRG